MIELVAQYIIPFVVGAVALVIVPPVKEWLKMKNVYDYVVIGVKAAEQIFNSKEGQKKYEYVKEWVQDKFNITDEELKMLIEAVVLEINKDDNKKEELK